MKSRLARDARKLSRPTFHGFTLNDSFWTDGVSNKQSEEKRNGGSAFNDACRFALACVVMWFVWKLDV